MPVLLVGRRIVRNWNILNAHQPVLMLSYDYQMECIVLPVLVGIVILWWIYFCPNIVKFFLEKMVNPSQVSMAVSPNSISQHLCNHSNTCKICSSVQPAKVDEIAEKVEWHKKLEILVNIILKNAKFGLITKLIQII